MKTIERRNSGSFSALIWLGLGLALISLSCNLGPAIDANTQNTGPSNQGIENS